MNWYTLSGSDGQPTMLVRLEWPKVQQYVTKDFPFWRKDPSLAALEWDSTGDICSPEKAARLIAEWKVDS